MAGEWITPRLLWENVQAHVVPSPDGYLLFDDMVADKDYSRQMAVVRRRWSGNTHRVIRAIGIVICACVNPQTEQFWIIDFRIFDPDADGQSKHDCRRARIIRKHSGCAFLVWVRLKPVTHESGQTTYQIKYGMLADYTRHNGDRPSFA